MENLRPLGVFVAPSEMPTPTQEGAMSKWSMHAEQEPPEPDLVNHPPHYKGLPSGIEVIEVTEHLNFCLGNVVKYVLRADLKGAAITDLKKAQWYLNRELERRAKEAETNGGPEA